MYIHLMHFDYKASAVITKLALEIITEIDGVLF